MQEEWKSIAGYEGLYEVSSVGRVRNRSRIMRPPLSSGYQYIGLAKNKLTTTYKVARLVAAAFIGEIPPKMVVNHKNGIRNDDRVENLEIVTYSENKIHGYAVLGNQPARGEGHGQSSLTNDCVRTIRAMYGEGHSQDSLSAIFNVSQSSISRIIRKQCWGHVTG